MPAWDMRGVLLAYASAPVIFMAIVAGILPSRGRPEMAFYLLTYAMSLAYLIIPCIVTLFFVWIVPVGRARNGIGSVSFLLLYVITQTAVVIDIGRALSTSKPDDPGAYEDLWSALTTFDFITRCATVAALATIVIGMLLGHRVLTSRADR